MSTAGLAPRVAIAEQCRVLGVKFIDHKEAARQHVCNLAAWAGLFGYNDFAKRTYVTLRPHIVHPVGLDDPLDDWRVIAHELVHWLRQPKGRCSLLGWVVKYGLRQKFRAIEEMHAHLEDIRNGRARRNGQPDVASVVERMRDWYRLGNVDPVWMREWMEERL